MSFITNVGDVVTDLNWQAPTENDDGSQINQQLTYNLYVNGEPVLSFPGSLNPDGSYGFPLAAVAAIGSQGTHQLALTAVDEDGDESLPTPSLEIRTVVGPKPPTGFTAI